MPKIKIGNPFRWYSHNYAKWPYAFAFGTMFFKGTMSDTMAQKFEQSKRERNNSNPPPLNTIDTNNNFSKIKTNNNNNNRTTDGGNNGNNNHSLTRTVRFAMFAGLYCGCAQHWIFNILYTTLFPHNTLRHALYKMLADAFIHTPFGFLPSYFMAKSVFAGGTAKDGLINYSEEWSIVLIECWKIWIPTMFSIFYFVPPQFRIGATAVIGLFYLSYLSYLSPMTDQPFNRNAVCESEDIIAAANDVVANPNVIEA